MVLVTPTCSHNIHEEWEQEDHDPSVGMIQFVNGNNMQLNTNAFRLLKPEVGDIYFFPMVIA